MTRTPVTTTWTWRTTINTQYTRRTDIEYLTADTTMYTADTTMLTADMTFIWQVLNTEYARPRKTALLLKADWQPLLFADGDQVSLAWWTETNKINTIWN